MLFLVEQNYKSERDSLEKNNTKTFYLGQHFPRYSSTVNKRDWDYYTIKYNLNNYTAVKICSFIWTIFNSSYMQASAM